MPPRCVGPWEILTVIGRGGVGTVYRARHLLDGMPAAVKLLGPAPAVDPVRLRPDVRVIILGHGEQKEDLELLADELGIRKNCMFRSFVTNILDYLHTTDIFVFPSEKEGMPNAVLEAMACVLPVIASRIGGVVDVVRDRSNGLLVEPGDPEGLREAILELCEKQERRTSLAEAACTAVRDNFSVETVVKRYTELYRNLCDED